MKEKDSTRFCFGSVFAACSVLGRWSALCFPFAWAHESISAKMHSIEIRFVKGPLIYGLEACVWALFSPEIVQAGAVKGLTENDLSFSASPLPQSDKLFSGFSRVVSCPANLQLPVHSHLHHDTLCIIILITCGLFLSWFCGYCITIIINTFLMRRIPLWLYMCEAQSAVHETLQQYTAQFNSA